MEEKIMTWISEYQSGKVGIYPYRVAEQVCITFGITIAKAHEYVLRHIRQVLEEVS